MFLWIFFCGCFGVEDDLNQGKGMQREEESEGLV